MRQDVKQLADAMEKGWQKIPHQNKRVFFGYEHNKIVSCCAMGHALVGARVSVSRMGKRFPILNNQKVFTTSTKIYMSLFEAIAVLNDNHDWTTLQVVDWLRTHVNG